MSATAANVSAHVFDNSEHRYFNFLEHLQSFFCIKKRDILWRGHNQRTRDRHFLRQRELGIPCSWWQIDDEIIQIIPTRVVKQLL